MKIELDSFIHIGEVAIAALAQSSIHCSDGLQVFSAHCTKRPVAILIRQHEVTMAFEIDGVPIPLEDFEQRYPGQRATFERLAITSTNSS